MGDTWEQEEKDLEEWGINNLGKPKIEELKKHGCQVYRPKGTVKRTVLKMNALDQIWFPERQFLTRWDGVVQTIREGDYLALREPEGGEAEIYVMPCLVVQKNYSAYSQGESAPDSS